MEYVEKRVQELVSMGAKATIAEALINLGTAGGAQAAEYSRLFGELQEAKLREVTTAIADLKKSVEEGDNVYAKRTEILAIVKAVYDRIDQSREDAVLESALAMHKRLPQVQTAVKADDLAQLKRDMEKNAIGQPKTISRASESTTAARGTTQGTDRGDGTPTARDQV